jgi:hypothetical protein
MTILQRVGRFAVPKVARQLFAYCVAWVEIQANVVRSRAYEHEPSLLESLTQYPPLTLSGHHDPVNLLVMSYCRDMRLTIGQAFSPLRGVFVLDPNCPPLIRPRTFSSALHQL